MSKLQILRNQITALHRTRRLVRWATAYAALAVALLWVLAAVFLLDYLFEMNVLQRSIVLLLGAVAVGWACLRFTLPLVRKRETPLEVALMVEKQHQIDSDLVAALQFESPEARQWGSPQLEQAVVDYVAQLGRGLNVFEGFSREQMLRRGATLAATLAVLAGLVVIFPSHARVFLNRLLLGSLHYPTATVIEQIVINDQPVLLRQLQGTAPQLITTAQGRPLMFVVQCSGELPSEGRAQLASTLNRQKRPLALQALTLEQRRERLEEARTRIARAVRDSELDIGGPWLREVASLLRFDAPQIAELVTAAEQDRGQLRQASSQLRQHLETWSEQAGESALYVGQLARMVEPLHYQLYLGDAWTDPAGIDLIPLPVIETRLTATPPGYARRAVAEITDSTSRQLSVLEGTQVEVALQCTNQKRLVEAWLVLKDQDGSRKFPLTQQDPDGHQWALDVQGTPFARVQDELRFEIQVTDEDGLNLEVPIRGYVRLKPDRPPSGSADLVHRVVVPTARPRLQYRVNDDYGIGRVQLHLQVERRADPNRLPVEDESLQDQRVIENLLPGSGPLLADQLPYQGNHQLNLSSLNLAKGDRLKLTLEVVDYRGEAPGESYRSDPLVVEISDESGVLAAISEADERSEQRLTDIIRQQLGIGESP